MTTAVETPKLYYSLKDYFLEKFGTRVQKITVALPFTCPNIDGTKGRGGCTYCYAGSIPPNLTPTKPIKRQIEEAILRYKRRFKNKKVLFTVYYQSYTNTYGSLEYLKSVYDAALEFDEVVGIDVGTRPDCVPEEVLDLLASYTEKGLEVWVEYGLQSANFETLKKINRKHGVSDFVDAVLRTKRRPLKVAAHIIVGLPGETEEDFYETAKLIAALPVDGLKIHPLYVMDHTPLGEAYKRGEFKPLPLEKFVKVAADIIEMMPPRVVIMRFTAEGHEDKLLAPEYCRPSWKQKVKKLVEEELIRRGTRQGVKNPFFHHYL
ncbi:MAG: TIGR01212 family radical SAM protein [Aquificae bacterium]|nr:TIGR01212 family radical SAM protein [Aquificota bacterium]